MFFNHLLIYVLPLEIQVSIGESWDPIIRLNAATFLCLSQKPGPGFPKSYVMVCFMFRELPLLFLISFSLRVSRRPHKSYSKNTSCILNYISTLLLRSLIKGPSWPWSHGSWIYNYLCNQCLSPLMLWVRISIRTGCTTLCDKVCQWLATGQ